eukprot:8559273-Prorocentrum_lima.AAC.1
MSVRSGTFGGSGANSPGPAALAFCRSRARRVYCQEKNSGVLGPKSTFSGVRECQCTHGSSAPLPSQMAGSSPSTAH